MHAVKAHAKPDRPKSAAPARAGATTPSTAPISQLAPLDAIPAGPGGDSAANGLPDQLRTRLEARSGLNFGDVVVQRNSAEPARLGAEAFARGREIHLAPGKDKHLAHEAWHLAQQARGQVRATGRAGGAAINSDPILEREADAFGVHASALSGGAPSVATESGHRTSAEQPAQLAPDWKTALGAGALALGGMGVAYHLWNRWRTPAPAPEKPHSVNPALKFTPKIDQFDEPSHGLKVHRLAEEQTLHARNMLYHPNERLKSELSLAAGKLHASVSALDEHDRNALGARILGPEGLMAGQTHEDMVSALDRVKNGESTATDRSATMALMGDVGALYADTGATTGTDREPEATTRLRTNITEQFKAQGLDAPDPASTERVKSIGGSSAVGPMKKIERVRPPDSKSARTGIHNTGEKIDAGLGIPHDQRLPKTSWDEAHISEKRVLASEEPFAGHMSGSPAEILQIWDMLRGEKREDQFTKMLDKPNPAHGARPMSHLDKDVRRRRMARAAGAAGFLVGHGYHSAVEVAEDTMKYSGQNVRGVIGEKEDAAHLMGHGASTGLMSELFKDYTDKTKRR